MTNKYDYSFTILVIRIAIKTSTSNTAPRSDGIPTRVLQLCELEEDVLNVLNSHSILSNNDNTVPDRWKHSIIVSILMKGNSSSLENQRGIAKSCAFAKLTNKLLLARIRDIIEPQLLGVQSGFCAGRSTVEQTMALRYILDYVLRETLLDNIDGFTITPHRSSRYPAVRIGALMYADDITITCDTIDQAKNVFQCLKMNASKVGLKINLKKTKILHAGHNSLPSPVTMISGYTLKICNDFLYLGVSTKTPLNVVKEKNGQAWFAIGKFRPIFISKISDTNKMRLSRAMVETIAAY